MTLRGVVTRGEHAASGVSIQLQNVTSGASSNTISIEDGSFQLSDLAPGQYRVIATLGKEQAHGEISIGTGSPKLSIHLPGPQPQSGSASAVSVPELQAPAKARTALDEAQKYTHNGDIHHALQKLREALAIAPGLASALALRAALLLQSGDASAALQDARAATASDPAYPAGYFVLAAVLNRNSQFGEAADAARQGLKLEPPAWQGHFELAQAFAGQNQHSEAVNEFNAAANTVPPTFPTVHLMRAVSLIKLQRYADADKDLQEVLRRDPKGPAGTAAQQIHAQLPKAQ